MQQTTCYNRRKWKSEIYNYSQKHKSFKSVLPLESTAQLGRKQINDKEQVLHVFWINSTCGVLGDILHWWFFRKFKTYTNHLNFKWKQTVRYRLFKIFHISRKILKINMRLCALYLQHFHCTDKVKKQNVER